MMRSSNLDESIDASMLAFQFTYCGKGRFISDADLSNQMSTHS